jgi:regulatory protein
MEEKQPDTKIDIKPSKIRLSAMGILAGREYLRSQLQSKLEKKFDNSSLIPDVDLKSRGAETVLVEQLLDEAEVDWFELAKNTAQLKFGSDHQVDAKEKAKRMRFLQYRGFSFDQINYALNN